MNETPPVIELNEFEYPSKDYFWLLFRVFVCYFAWYFAYIALIIFALVFRLRMEFGSEIPIIWFPLAILPIVLLTIVLSLTLAARFAYSKNNKCVFEKRKLTFDDSMIHVYVEDGSNSHLRYEQMVSVRKDKKYYYVFLTQAIFYAIPFSAFRTKEDQIRFETEIVGNKLTIDVFPWLSTVTFLWIATILLGIAFYFGEKAANKHQKQAGMLISEQSIL